MATKKSKTIDPIEVKKKMLEAYMRRQVSGMHTLLNQKAYVLNVEPRDLYRTAYDTFANPEGLRLENTVLGEIYDDIADGAKSYSVYNYFDLDTLISYGRFLQKVLENVSAYPKEKLRRNDFSEAMSDAGSWLRKNRGKVETWFYQPTKPVKCRIDERGYLAPERTLSMDDFDKKYNENICEEALIEYQDVGLENDLIEYCGKKYYIKSSKNYRTYPEETNVRYIEADRRGGSISGYLDENGQPYYGPIYTIDTERDEYVYYDEADGINLVDKGVTLKGFPKLYRRSSAQKRGGKFTPGNRPYKYNKGGR